MAAQVLRDKGVVTKMDYIICTGTVRRRDLCKFNRGLLANVTDWIQQQGDRALIPCVGSGQAETEAETDGTGVETKLISD